MLPYSRINWSHHTFISCFFHILRARKQISSQESKSSIGLMNIKILNVLTSERIAFTLVTDWPEGLKIWSTDRQTGRLMEKHVKMILLKENLISCYTRSL